MQIAHIMNQLSESGALFMPILTGKMTVKYLREYMLGELRHIRMDLGILTELLKCRIQFRYD